MNTVLPSALDAATAHSVSTEVMPMSNLFSSQPPVVAVMRALQQMTKPTGECFDIRTDSVQRGKIEQSLDSILTEMGPLFFEETAPSQLGLFSNACVLQHMDNPGLMLVDLVRNFMLTFADTDHQGSAKAVYDELDALAQSVRQRRTSQISSLLSELSTWSDPRPTAQILPFKKTGKGVE